MLWSGFIWLRMETSAVMLITYNRKVLGSDLGRNSADWDRFWFSPASYGEYGDSALE
jgi:hypothetical protein